MYAVCGVGAAEACDTGLDMFRNSVAAGCEEDFVGISWICLGAACMNEEEIQV